MIAAIVFLLTGFVIFAGLVREMHLCQMAGDTLSAIFAALIAVMSGASFIVAAAMALQMERML